MSFVTAHPEILTAAASSLASIGTTMSTEVSSAAPVTIGVVPPATDPISIMNSIDLISGGVSFQQISAAASVVHQQIVTTLAENSAGYEAAEAANVIATSL